MRVIEASVSEEHAGQTVREYARRVMGLSAGFLTEQRKLPGGILRNGVPCRTVDVLFAGDRLIFSLPEETMPGPGSGRPFGVLYEDEDFLAAEKPPDMPVHPSPGHDLDSLLNAVTGYYLRTGQSHRFRPLYRLDRDTSGILLIAKHRAAACAAHCEKLYLAVCEGTLFGSGVFDSPIRRVTGSRILREAGEGERAVTRWESLAAQDGHTLLALRLETGRTHQIRVHLSAAGHPLAGDDLYGGGLSRVDRQALHCAKATLSCPALSAFGQKTFFSDLPEDLRRAFPWLPPGEKLAQL